MIFPLNLLIFSFIFWLNAGRFIKKSFNNKSKRKGEEFIMEFGWRCVGLRWFLLKGFSTCQLSFGTRILLWQFLTQNIKNRIPQGDHFWSTDKWNTPHIRSQKSLKKTWTYLSASRLITTLKFFLESPWIKSHNWHSLESIMEFRLS